MGDNFALDLFARQGLNQNSTGAGGGDQEIRLLAAVFGLKDTKGTLELMSSQGWANSTIGGLGTAFASRGGDKLHELAKQAYADIAEKARSIVIGPSSTSEMGGYDISAPSPSWTNYISRSDSHEPTAGMMM